MASARRKGLRKIYKAKSGRLFSFLKSFECKCPRILCTYLLGTLGKILRLFTISPQRLYLLNVERYCTIYYILDEGFASSPLVCH